LPYERWAQLDDIRFGGVDVGGRECVADEDLAQQPVGAAVEVLRDDEVVAGLQEKERRRDRRHPRGKGTRSRPTI